MSKSAKVGQKKPGGGGGGGGGKGKVRLKVRPLPKLPDKQRPAGEQKKYLVSQGAQVERGNNDGETPLIAASGHGHLDVVPYLMSKQAQRKEASPKVLPGMGDGVWKCFRGVHRDGINEFESLY
eukprot:XP_011682645.1 PREDICTED: uncharacterized protein LOC105446923 [Strongylocentrotus purpuratus]